MIHKTLQTLTGNLPVSIPEGLHELKLAQLMAMQAADNMSDLQAIHILSGVPLQELQQVKQFTDLQIFNDQVLVLAHQIKHLYNSSEVPTNVTFTMNCKARKIKVMKNLSIEPAGAFMAARDIIADEISKRVTQHGDENWQETFNPSLQACSQVLAHYFYSPVTGNLYDEEQATQFVTQVEQLSVNEALPIARYFFLNYPNLSRPRTGFWHRLLQSWKSGRALPSFKSSGTSTPSTPWPAAI